MRGMGRVLAAVAILLALSWPAAASGLSPVRIEGSAPSFALDGHFSQYAGKAPPLSLEEVIREDAFTIPQQDYLAAGVRWYRVTVERAPHMPTEWILAFGEPDIDDVRVFVPRDHGGFDETRLGRQIPSIDLPLAGRRHMARITLPETPSATLYLRLSSAHKIRFEQAALWRPDALIYPESQEIARLGIRLGMLAVLVVGYGLFGLWMRDAVMLLYALYVSTILSRALTHTGMVTLLFPAAGSGTNYFLGAVGLMGGTSAFVFMWDRILGLREAMPRIHRIYLAVGTMMVVLLLLSPITQVWSLAAGLSQAVMLAACITSVVLAVLMMRRSTDQVLLKFYLAAFLPVVAVAATRVISLLVPAMPIALARSLDIASNSAHIAILAVALAYRLGRLETERARIRQELAGERRVQQRLRTFIDMASHEFKTPLAVIDSAAQVMKLMAAGRPELTGRTDAIRQAVKRLDGLIETCLAGERYERVGLSLAQVSPGEIVDQAAGRARLVENTAIAIDAPERGLPDAVAADGAMLGIALDALIDNARRYGAAGQEITLSLRVCDGQVDFGVHDRGPGVPAEDADHIFEKFYRCAATASTSGTGIGLHLVKTIAELHGGAVVYAPRSGGGASFTLSIPIARARR